MVTCYECGARALEEVLGYHFDNPGLLERALTHKSSIFEKNAEASAADNERLEFLGDAILGFVVSDMLVARHPDLSRRAPVQTESAPGERVASP